MKQAAVVVIGLMLMVAAVAGSLLTSNDLMRKAYAFDKSTYDTLEVIVDYGDTKIVEFNQGGRNCYETWLMNDGELVKKYNKGCVNH